MITLASDLKVVVATKPIDFRRGMNGLVAMVASPRRRARSYMVRSLGLRGLPQGSCRTFRAGEIGLNKSCGADECLAAAASLIAADVAWDFVLPSAEAL